MPGIVPIQVQDFAHLLVELAKILVSPFLQLVEIPLEVCVALSWVSHSSQFCAICKFTEGALYIFVQIVNEDVKQDWTQY